MTDEERLEEDRKLGILNENASKAKPKWKFLQKYYHKGAFYMDNDSLKSASDIRTKDYSEPTLEDRIDKEKLPQILQVKNFGKRGRTKYTHLLDQDTTVSQNKRIDVRPDGKVMDSYLSRMSGMKKV
jgi:microfibrillar-associated protein 1